MALYKFLNFIEHTQDANFDVFYPPEGTAPRSGIYRCRGCGREILSEELKPLPPKLITDMSPRKARFGGNW